MPGSAKKKQRRATATGILRLDDDPVNKAISFCDFDTMISVGVTCKRMHKLSCSVLDQLADEIMTKRMKGWSDPDVVFYEEHLRDGDEAGVQVTIRKNWSSRFRSKAALDQAVIDNIREDHDIEDIDFDADRARYLLRTTGQVNLENFLPPGEGRHDQGFKSLDEVGWDISAKHTTVTRVNAAAFLVGTVVRSLRGGEGDGDSDVMDISDFSALYGFSNGSDLSDNDGQNSDDNNDDGLEKVTRGIELFRHYVLSLLRLADSPISRSKLRITYHHTDYGEEGTFKVFNFKLAGSDAEVEISCQSWYGKPQLSS